MNREQAKLILSAANAGEEYPEGDPRLEKALALMENDPALAEWFAAQNPLDHAMRDALRTIEPPAHLRESILAAAKVTPFPEEPKLDRIFPILWMSAAGFVALAAAVAIYLAPRGNQQNVASIETELIRLTDAHKHAFGSKDLGEIRSWLASHGGATDFSIPQGLENRGGAGCEVVSVSGTKVSVLCFHLGHGRTAHLYIVNRSQLSKPPPQDTPVVTKNGAYAVASWSAGDKSYFLSSQGDEKSLRALL